MDYKKEIIEMVQKIDSDKFMKFLYNMIVSFKSQWGYQKKGRELIPAFFMKKFNHVENTFLVRFV